MSYVVLLCQLCAGLAREPFQAFALTQTMAVIYLDGQAITSAVLTEPYNLAGPFFVGSYPSASDPGFTGWIDSLVVMNVALSSTDVKAMYEKNLLPCANTV